MDTCNKILSKIVYVKDKQKFMVRRKTKTYNYDSLNQRRLGRNPIAVKEEYLELNVLGEKEPKKSINCQIIILKKALDPESLNTLSAYFTQDLEVSVLSDSRYIYQYLIKCENRPFLCNLDSAQTCPIALTGSQEGVKKEFLGKEKRLSEAEAQELIDSGIPVYQKIGDEYRILV